VDHSPNESQPNTLTIAGVLSGLRDLVLVHEYEWTEPFGHDGHRVVLVAEKAGGPHR
jgi:hypothetical protein